MDKQRLRSALRKAFRKMEQEQWITGKLGKLNADGTYTFDVAGRPGFVNVTIRNANGAQTVVAARNDARVEHAARLSVKMKLEYGVYVLYGRDGRADLGNNPVSPPYGVVPHGATHENGGGDDIGSIAPGAYELVKANASGKIENGYLDLEGILGSFVEGSNIDIDLTDPDNPVLSVDLNESSAKVTPIDADSMPLIDSADSNILKKVTWANIKATLKVYFDTLYNLYVHPNHTGDVTSVGDGVTTIAADVVTNAKAANMAESTIKGRAVGAGTGDPTDLTATQVRTIINVEAGADVTDAANIASSIIAQAGKTTPIDTDIVPILDSADSYQIKELSWANVKATLKTYFDTLYGLLATANTWVQNQTIASTQTTGNALRVIRNLAAASTDDAVVEIIQDNATDDQPALVVQQDGSGAILILLDGASEVMRVADGGNVGIGTSSPQEPLEVSQASATTGGRIITRNPTEVVGASATFYFLTGSGAISSANALAFYRAVITQADPSQLKSELQFYNNRGDSVTLGMILTDSGQLVVGLSSANANILGIKAGTSSNDAAVGGVLYVSTAQTGNVGTGTDDLASYSVPANTLAVNGQSLWFEAFGTTPNNANAKTLSVLFGSTTIATWSLTTSSTNIWTIRGRIIRTGASAEKAYTTLISRTVNAALIDAAVAETLSGALNLKIQGAGTSNDDIVLEGFMVGWDDNNT